MKHCNKHLFACFALFVATCTASTITPEPKYTRNWNDYKITGWAHKLDVNKGFIYDSRFTEVEFTFEDPRGNRAYARCNLYLKTLGFSFALTANWYWAKIVGSSLTLKEFARERIGITNGVMLEGTPGVGLGMHAAGLRGHKGILLIIAPTIGLSFEAGIIFGGYIEMQGKPMFEDLVPSSTNSDELLCNDEGTPDTEDNLDDLTGTSKA